MFANIFNGPGSIRAFLLDGLGMVMCGAIAYGGFVTAAAVWG